jgi:RimJ/RimL family protein N-acetyltransferase
MEAQRTDKVKPFFFRARDGKNIRIREAEVADAEHILDFAGMIFATTDSVLTTPGEFSMTPDAERQFITTHRQQATSLLLIAEHDNQIIGFLNFSCYPKVKMSHTGELGISIHPNYRSKGIGRAMVDALITWATDVAQIEKLLLKVFSTNANAITLYEDLGFVTEGREIQAIKQPDGSYADLLTMGLFLSR